MAKPFLVSNELAKVGTILSQLSEGSDTVHIAVAFLSSAEPIVSWLTSGMSVKLVVGLQPPTDADVLRKLVDSFPVDLEARFYSTRFHSKLYIFLKEKTPVSAQVGSSNCTGGGLYSNLETNVILHDVKQLRQLAIHFASVWKASANLEPDDIDAFQKYCHQNKVAISNIKKKQEEFELRFVKPRIAAVRAGPVYKEARDYLAFWKAVDDVKKITGGVATKEWPSVPPYLAIDHFWHWLVKIWNKDGLRKIKDNPNVRAKRLRELFVEYATWDKDHPTSSVFEMKQNSDYLRKVLSKSHLRKLTKEQAHDIYNRLHSGRMRAKRFGSDTSFVRSNSLTKIRHALAYLLWSDGDIQERISALLPGGRHHLQECGPSSVQELVGWIQPNQMPLRNDKADKALEMLGYKFR